MKKNNKGIGSFFPFIENNVDKFLANKTSFNPEDKMLFYTGRQAIKYIIELIALEKKSFIIWLPEYYCMHVTHWLKSNYSNIKTYKTNPSKAQFSINAFEFASDNDVVIINNFWGIHDCIINKGDKKIVTIEDHSHGWLSNSCINSKADYCMTSLRKTLPIPLGGMVWSPKNHPVKKNVPLLESHAYEAIWNKIQNAMQLKHDFEKTGDLTLKEKSLLLISETELALHQNYSLTQIHPTHEKTIKEFLSINYSAFKLQNLQKLSACIKPNDNFEIIAHHSSRTFGLILYINNEAYLDQLRSHLIDNNIYPSLLWPNNKKEYGYYLNIHVDFRYTCDDMHYIADALNAFNHINHL
ncbi:hypothetical protein APS56_02220 [Pseudalgibacter alginicilyticus]|uniref:Aminotransferase class I/classII domain-containing protein n=1 Tax=Pseudalgibacter alginicilyticus TaxID=1736674 RepID=A0A0P0CUM4_9FLAO|nr:hypothetical protein [Pseudalgibacter alginicilyticus]ALJ04042.1 hypothetical protein APS56_02220 [Pseudalgibacter alginicilyticus]